MNYLLHFERRMRMAGKWLVVILFVLLKSGVWAQQVPFTGMGYLNKWLYNPAYTGLGGGNAFLSGKSQWAGRKGDPETYMVTMDGNFGKGKQGYGLMAYNDVVNIIGKTGVYGNYSRQMKMAWNSVLSGGVSVGFEQYRVLPYRINNEVPKDITLPGGSLKTNHVDVNAGIGYYLEGIQLGLAGYRLFDQGQVQVKSQNPGYYDFQFQRHFLASASYTYDAFPGKIAIKPLFQYRTDMASQTQWDATVTAHYKQKFWLGGSYRQQYGAEFLGGTTVLDKYTVAYSFLLPSGENRKLYTNTHEVVLSYRFRNFTIHDDRDNDGVEDFFDLEPETKKGCLVDRAGISMDADRDNIIDCLDKEINTPFGAPVDQDGVALDSDQDKIIDLYDQEDDTPAGCPVDESGIALDSDKDGIPDCKDRPEIRQEDPPVSSLTNEQTAKPDADGDNIPDELDQEINTPHWQHLGVAENQDASGCIVNLRGVATDSDGDGVFDCVDDEIYSPKGARVSKNGVALSDHTTLVPDKAEDSDGDGISDDLDLEPGTPKGSSVDQWGRSPKTNTDPAAIHRISIEEVEDHSEKWDYYVIVGVFRYYNNLKNYQKYLLKTYNESTQVLVTDQNYYYVWTKQVYTKEEARQETMRLTEKRLKDYIVGNPWLWREEKK